MIRSALRIGIGQVAAIGSMLLLLGFGVEIPELRITRSENESIINIFVYMPKTCIT